MIKKHLFHILCLLPITGFLFWLILNQNVGNVLMLGLVLVCPLSHIFLMRHSDGHEGCHSDNKNQGDSHEKKGGEENET